MDLSLAITDPESQSAWYSIPLSKLDMVIKEHANNTQQISTPMATHDTHLLEN